MRSAVQTDLGFKLALPAGVPWNLKGKASLCFMGRATFVGVVEPTPEGADLRVERALPVLPFVKDLGEVWAQTGDTHQRLRTRLEAELARRNQPLPTIPDNLPAPTPGSLLRAERTNRLMNEIAKQGSPQTGAPYVPDLDR